MENDFDLAGALATDSLEDAFEKWVSWSPGEFSVMDIDREIEEITKELKKGISKKDRTFALEALVEKGILERSGKKRGWYRPVRKDLQVMDFKNCDDTPVKLWLPFNIHEVVKLYPGNIIQISGEKNAGKTTLVLNIIKSNRKKWNVKYFNSEMGAAELRSRLTLFDDIVPEMWDFEAYERSSDFGDVIFPGEGNLNIIDFLECHDDFYLMGKFMREIHDKLNGAIAIVCVQKNQGTDKGLGGSRTEEKARLILSVKPNTVKINMAKNWVQNGPDSNPNGRMVDFKLVGGAKLIQDGGWYKHGYENE